MAQASTSSPTLERVVAPGVPAPFVAESMFPPLAKVVGAGGSIRVKPGSSINEALDRARPGDVIMVSPGTYTELVRSVRPGEPTRPIRLVGEPGAIIEGSDLEDDRLVEFQHSYLTLEGFTLGPRTSSSGCKAPPEFGSSETP